MLFAPQLVSLFFGGAASASPSLRLQTLAAAALAQHREKQ
jgi:hypothetical protein